MLGRMNRAEAAVDVIEALEELPDGEDWFGLDDAPIEGMDAPALDIRSEADLFSDLDANSSPEAVAFEELEALDQPAVAPLEHDDALFDELEELEELDLGVADDPGAALMLEGWELGDVLDAPAALAPAVEAPVVEAPALVVHAQQAETVQLSALKPAARLGASLFDEEEEDPFLDASRPLEAQSQPEVDAEQPAERPSYTFFDDLSSRGGGPGDFLPELEPADEDPLSALGDQQNTRQGDGDLSLAELLAREPAPRVQESSFSLGSLFDELELGFLPESPAAQPPPAPQPAPAAQVSEAHDLLLPPAPDDGGFEWGGAELFPDLPVERARVEPREAISGTGSSSKGPQRWLTVPPAAMEDEQVGELTRIPGMMFHRDEPPAPLKQENPPTIEHAYEMASSGDDFDFDLGPSRPTTQLPAVAAPPQPPAPTIAAADDDFDFDLGPSRPIYQVAASPAPIAPTSAAPALTPRPKPPADDDDFDFDLGLNMPQSSYHPPVGQEHSSSSSIRLTPAAPQSSISAFERQKTPPAGAQPEPGVTEDEFFALAESLAPKQSATATAQPRPYRGEPMVRRGEPQPAPEAPRVQRSASSSNPFAHDAPTGVRKALVESSQADSASQASFVLEEIEPADEPDSASQIRRLYDEGKISQAWSRVETVALQEADNTDMRALRAKIEQEMERLQLRRLGPLTRVPHLSVAPNQLSTLNLDHRSGFLISQIDGTMCFEDILDLSSMSRLETLMVLADLLEKQVIKAS